MVEPAGADIVGPAVTADDPDAAPDQVIDHTAQITGPGGIEALEATLQFGHPLPLGVQLRLTQLRRRQDGVDELGTEHVA